MKLDSLLKLIEPEEEYKKLIDELKKTGSTNAVVLEAAKPYLIAALYKSRKLPILVVMAQPEKCRLLYEQVSAWSNSKSVMLFPEPDSLPYEHIAPDDSVEMERLKVLSTLTGINGNGNSALVIASAPALMRKITPYKDFVSTAHTIKLGTETEPFELLRKWEAMGYNLENTVEIPGSMSHRGGIVDIYPPTSELPARFEFFGNKVDSIRLFDPLTQRSVGKAPSVTIGPATEMLSPSPKKGSLLDFLPEDALLVLDEPSAIETAIDELDTQAKELFNDKVNKSELPPDFPLPYFSWPELEKLLSEKPQLKLTAFGTNKDGIKLNFANAPAYGGQLPVFIKKLKEELKQKKRLILVSHQASRLSELLGQAEIIALPVTEIKQIPPPGSLTLLQGLLAEGWVSADETAIFTDAEIFGFIKQQRLLKKRPVAHHKLLIELSPGDFVVHIEHGIARFSGVTKMSGENGEREYLVLSYAANDKLYVPADQIDRVSRYIGGGEKPPTINRLGTQEWTQTKRKVKESVEAMAGELLNLYAAREIVTGFAFSADTVWQQELEASFPYVETPDQIEVQEQVKRDMAKPKPMDRLICGDVGYGKTEVAIRAAFKAVMDNKQVAMLVPTTVLAEQHFATFSQRLEAFPVKVEVLSRFRTLKEQKTILDGLTSGSVDICIGTHRLLQKDVVFKNLGLLIIDEEQRFGVSHKEYLKKMRKEVDVLTLSATPIPRTLHMSLVRVRDMSTMETPPDQRLPIKTYVAEYDEHLIREAVIRELERNGQVFFVHNRVQSIDFVASTLQSLIPEARIAVAHGQMAEDELERVMTDFARGKSDILVCTTIIESGLDMPNANTLIVNRADRFGLTQLYQLRGRVGRGAHLAHAYFLYDKAKRLTDTAEKRLKTIFEATELGAGFQVALKDLEIRGAGNLLGTKQSGYINAVGFSLYCRLLADAVEAQKAKRAGIQEKDMPTRLPPPPLDLPLRAFIPDGYVTDTDTRLNLYQRLSALKKPADIEAFRGELKDRFGAVPKEVENLLYAVKIKMLAAEAGIESIATENSYIVLRVFNGMQFDKAKLEPVASDSITISKTQIRLEYKRVKGWRETLEGLLRKLG